MTRLITIFALFIMIQGTLVESARAKDPKPIQTYNTYDYARAFAHFRCRIDAIKSAQDFLNAALDYVGSENALNQGKIDPQEILEKLADKLEVLETSQTDIDEKYDRYIEANPPSATTSREIYRERVKRSMMAADRAFRNEAFELQNVGELSGDLIAARFPLFKIESGLTGNHVTEDDLQKCYALFVWKEFARLLDRNCAQLP